MALKITSSVGTDKGTSNEVYVMINEIYIAKNLNTQLGVKTFKNKAERDVDINDTCRTFVVKHRFDYTLESLNVTITDLYNLIKTELIGQGLTVEDLI